MKQRALPYITLLFSMIFFHMLSSHEPSASEELSKNVIKYGVDMQVVTEMEIKDAKTTIDFWIRQFFDNAGLNSKTIVYKRSKRFFKDFKNGNLDVVTTSAINYIHLQDYADTKTAFTPVQNGKKTIQYLLLVQAGSGVDNIHLLKGKQLSIKKNDDIGRLFLNTYLLQNNIQEAEDFFDIISEKPQHSQSVLSVFFGQSDLCMTLKRIFDTMVELNPQVGKKLKAIAFSPELVSTVIFFNKNTEPTVKNAFKNAVENILQDPHGRQFMMLFKLENVVSLNPRDLDSLKELIKIKQELQDKY